MNDLVKKTLHYSIIYYANCPELVFVADYTGETSRRFNKWVIDHDGKPLIH